MLTGKNGVGKSTLLRLIAGLIPNGSIDHFEGRIEKFGKISIVFQRPNTQIITFRVDEEIVSPLSFKNISREERKRYLHEELDDLKIKELLLKDPRKLSAGEQQKIVIATSIATRADILLLDEPLSYLDDENASIVTDYLKTLKNNGKTIIITTHAPNRFQDLPDNYYELVNSNFNKYTIEDQYSADTSVEMVTNIQTKYEIKGIIGWTNNPLKSVNLKFGGSGLYVITGKNGSGKTTLLLTLAKIIDLQRGMIDFPDETIFIPHNSFQFFWKSSVLEELEQLQIPKWIEKQVSKSPFELSVGYQKLLSIYIGLYSSNVVIIDEPSKSLHKELRSYLFDLFHDFNSHKLIIIATNDGNFLKQISSFVTRIYRM